MKNKQEWVVRVTRTQITVNIDLGTYTEVKEKIEPLNSHLRVVLRHFIFNHYNPSKNLDQTKPSNSMNQYIFKFMADDQYLNKINEMNNAHWNRSNLFRDAFKQLLAFLYECPDYYRRSTKIIKSQYKIRDEIIVQLNRTFPFKQKSINIELFLKNHYDLSSFEVGIHKGANLKTTRIELDSLAHDILDKIANTNEVSKSVVMRDVVNQILEYEDNKKELR
ncbi:hypothetical protein [Bacillus pumilus]|uniref:hypothetical protein n=1 Tax=Bacillus pumilus TaxID=1408 RepID=UPI0011A2E8FA|nr:hypothetical protein [Bacillus pumilus]